MDSKDVIERVRTAVGLRLDQGGYIDGYSYDLDEWTLKAIGYHAKSNCYYALVEVDSIRAPKEALYEIDANDEDWGTDNGDLAIHVGRYKIEMPDECVEIFSETVLRG